MSRRQGVIVELARSPEQAYVGGRQLVPAALPENASAAAVQRYNKDSLPVDFGPLVTCGSCRLTVLEGQLVITPLPEGGSPFNVRLHWSALPWRLAIPTRVEAWGHDGQRISSAPLRRDADDVLVTCQPEVFQYRLTKPNSQ